MLDLQKIREGSYIDETQLIDEDIMILSLFICVISTQSVINKKY